MTATRVDFKHVRAHADFLKVLGAYGITHEKDGTKAGQYKALCPFHDDKKPSLKVNAERNIYHCFACEAHGNILEFVLHMDKLPEDEIRTAAIKVANICGIAPSENGKPTKGKSPKTKPSPKVKASPAGEASKEPQPAFAGENKELSFTLQLSMPGALVAWLDAHGIDQATATLFGIGLASVRSKTMAHRLAIPLHNKGGKLVGYCGRYLGDDAKDDVPKYILPMGFHKEAELFNLHRLIEPVSYVVIFESYLSVMRHHGQVSCVSAFGRSISLAQIDLLKATGATRVVIVFDGDAPGRDGAQVVAGLLAPHLWVRTVALGDGVKPHHLPWQELRPLLEAVWPKKHV